MKFTDSPVIDLAVGGTTLLFQQDNGSMHVGTSVWPCSLVLVKFVERCLQSPNPNPNYSALFSNLSSKRAIELGSGCGPAGLGLLVLGLADILLTDIAPVLPALRRNIKRNRPKLPKAPKFHQLYWNNPDQIRDVKPPFDFVVAADVVYMEDSAGWLVDAMEQLVGEDGVVLLGYQLRSPEAHRLFWEKVGEVFGTVEKVPKEDLHPEYAYEETDVFILRKGTKKNEHHEEIDKSNRNPFFRLMYSKDFDSRNCLGRAGHLNEFSDAATIQLHPLKDITPAFPIQNMLL